MMRQMSVAFALMAIISSLSADLAALAGQPTQQVLKILPNGERSLTGQRTQPVYKEVAFEYTVMVPQTEIQKQERDGILVDVPVTKYRPETRTATKQVVEWVTVMNCMPVDLEKVKAFETDGRPIDVDDLARRCHAETLVVVSDNDEMIPDYYAAVFKPGTIILALPPVQYPPPQDMAPPVLRPGQVIPQPVPSPSGRPTAGIPSVMRFVSQLKPTNEAPPQASYMPQLPTSPAPEFVFLSRHGADLLKIRQFEESEEIVEVKVRQNDSSVSAEKQVKAERLMRHSETTSLPWSMVRISQPGSGDIPIDRVKEKLGSSGETTGLLSRDGSPVDSFWLQNFKSSVAIVRGVKLPPLSSSGPVGSGYAAPQEAPGAAPAFCQPAPPPPAFQSAPQPKPQPTPQPTPQPAPPEQSVVP